MGFIRRKRTMEESGASRFSSSRRVEPEPPAMYVATVEEALRFLDYVEAELLGDERYKYDQFTDILCDLKHGRIGREEVIRRVKILFAGHPDLILGFNEFLPPGYKINIEDGEDEAP